MMGHRGVRLGISYPEIYSMQIRAILEAAALCAREGAEIHPEIMVPQVATVEELKRIHSYVERIHKIVELTHGIDVKFKFGTMLEVVRACLRAGRMAETAEFFSFGTNDLTQATFSFSPSRSVARTRKTSSCRRTTSRASCRTTRSRCWTSRAWAS